MRNKICIAFSFISCNTLAHVQTFDTIVIEGRDVNLLGEAVSSSEGVVGQQELQIRPILRTGEILELVPGMVATQHSGTGKANQYFLRGFNLDHGTDFSTYVDGMPINMRSHGHGQGYTDLNFIIPETIHNISYKKGPYYADVGDFSGSGSAAIYTTSYLESGLAEITLGEDAYQRLLVMDSFQTGAGSESLVAFEGTYYDGPWTDIDEDLDRKNALLKHQTAFNGGRLTLSFMAHDNQWNSADQIPERAVNQGLIDELGSIDTTVGGETSRYSLSASWQKGAWNASAYLIDYDLNLWSNFTYFLEDEDRGDQFEQVDDRLIYGGQVNYLINGDWAGKEMTNRLGMEMRIDDIDEVGLYHTQARQRLGVIRSDEVDVTSIGLFWENRLKWNDQIHSIIGARYDFMDSEVSDRAGTNTNGIDLSANSGSNSDDLFSLKGSLVYAFHPEWETYIAAGQGFHTNDSRGTTTRIDPADGAAVDPVDTFVRSIGYEIGVRGFVSESLNTSVSLWELNLDSELLFVGDAGNTEPSRESKRQGIELTAYYHFTQQWSMDLEYAYTDAEFSESAPEGNHIPGAIEQVLQAGLNANFANGWFGSLRYRHFGERPLIEDGSVTSDSSSVWNLRAGYTVDQWTFKADVLNLTDSNDHDIDYFYESRLSGEASGEATEDVHYHVMEPRTVRFSLGYRF